MSDLSQTLKKGTLLIFEMGEYDDRSWTGPLRMLKNAVKGDLVAQYIREWKPDPSGYPSKPGPDEFVIWLVTSGYAEDVNDSHAWHLGSYGEFEPGGRPYNMSGRTTPPRCNSDVTNKLGHKTDGAT